MNFNHQEEAFIKFYELRKNNDPEAFATILNEHNKNISMKYNVNQLELVKYAESVISSIETSLDDCEKLMNAIVSISEYYIATNNYTVAKYQELLEAYYLLFLRMERYSKSIDLTTSDITFLLEKANLLDEDKKKRIESRLHGIRNRKCMLISNVFCMVNIDMSNIGMNNIDMIISSMSSIDMIISSMSSIIESSTDEKEAMKYAIRLLILYTNTLKKSFDKNDLEKILNCCGFWGMRGLVW